MKKNSKGKLIVIDGSDGSGKATQTKLLLKYLKKSGIKARTLDFPQYDNNFFGSLIEKLLHDVHLFSEIDPRIVSTLYAADRWESKEQIEEWLAKGFTIILDRYTTSNQIHQGGKISNPKKRAKFIAWLEKMEYKVFQIPRPDLVIYLDIPVEISLLLLENSKKKLDHAEKNTTYLKNSRSCALWLSKKNKNWKKVVCTKNGKMKSKDEIHELIRKIYLEKMKKK